MNEAIKILANSQTKAIHFIRIAIFIVMAWIGGLKAFQYEADGIVPFVSNSPLMRFMYKNSNKTYINTQGEQVGEYTLYRNKEGQMVVKNIAWHKENGTYIFSYGLGTMIVSIGVLILLGIWFPKIGMVGGLLTFGMSIVTLSFLITTPEVYVANLGGRFSYAKLWFSIPFRSRTFSSKGHYNDGRRANCCLRMRTKNISYRDCIKQY